MAERNANGDVFVAASAAVLLTELLNVRVWLGASRHPGSQSDRVGEYLNALPMGVGRIGATWLTLLCVAGAMLGAFLAHRARERHAASKGLTLSLQTLNLAVAVWLLFTLM